MLAILAAQEALIHDKIFESFNEFVSNADEKGFEMMIGGRERVATRLAGKRRERSEREERSESGERHDAEIERKKD